MAYQILTRRDTAANWTSNNPTLAQGERGFETDTKKEKIGDGSTAWTSLAYVDVGLVHLAGTETITGTKTFSNAITAPSISSSPTISSGVIAPSSTPTKIGDMYVDTTNKKMYISKGTSSSSDWIKQNGSYTLSGGFIISALSPADATTYYFGWPLTGTTATSSARKIYVPRTGVISAVNGIFYNAGNGSTETSNLYIRVNNTTDYLISSAIVNNATETYLSVSGLSIPLAAGDYFNFKWVTPTWATNPTNTNCMCAALIDL